MKYLVTNIEYNKEYKNADLPKELIVNVPDFLVDPKDPNALTYGIVNYIDEIILELTGVKVFKFTGKRKETAKTFRSRVEPLISQIEDIINEMPDKGDSMRESQKLCLLQALNEFYYTVNGVEDSDFEEDKEEDEE